MEMKPGRPAGFFRSALGSALNFGRQFGNCTDQGAEARARRAVAARRAPIRIVPNLGVKIDPFAWIASDNVVARQKSDDRLVLPVKQDGRIAL
jgi:hypothetical protein